MQIISAKNSGFCSGVRRAYCYIKNHYQKFTPPLKIYGNLVHNTQVVKETEEWGIATIKNFNKNFRGTLIIPTHGIHKTTLRKINQEKIQVIDMTCPRVLSVINQAKNLNKKNKKVLILGDRKHTEVQAIASAVKKNHKIFSSSSKLIKWLDKNKKDCKCGIVFQTTSNTEEYKLIKEYCRKEKSNIEIINTICPATQARQNEAKKIAKKVDCMLVIGSKTSANSNQLYKLCKNKNPRTYFINNPDQINKKMFKPHDTIGVTAGASTPDYVINHVIKKTKTIEERSKK